MRGSPLPLGVRCGGLVGGNRGGGEVGGDGFELLQGGAEVFDDLGGDEIGVREGGDVLQGVVFEPEDVKAGFIAGEQFVQGVGAPTAGGVVRGPGEDAGVAVLGTRPEPGRGRVAGRRRPETQCRTSDGTLAPALPTANTCDRFITASLRRYEVSRPDVRRSPLLRRPRSSILSNVARCSAKNKTAARGVEQNADSSGNVRRNKDARSSAGPGPPSHGSTAVVQTRTRTYDALAWATPGYRYVPVHGH